MIGEGVIHIAGLDVQVGPYLRQRCAWCGAVLLDYDLRRVAMLISDNDPHPQPGTFIVGGLIRHDGNMWIGVEHEDGANLPPEACAVLDPSVTV